MNRLWSAFRQRFPGVPESDRWIVVDTETSGLDPDRDHLLSVGAVALQGGQLQVADSFELTVDSPAPVDTDNILLHGIGVAARRAGVPLAVAMARWRGFRRDDPLIAFHAPFDRRVLQTAARRCGLAPDHRPWLDVAELASALHPGPARQRHSLDDWLAHMGLPMGRRHNAMADALATATLLMRLHADAGRPATFRSLVRTARDHRNIGGSGA